MIEYINRTAFKDGLGEQKKRHVRSSPWAVNGEEPESGGRHAEQVAIGMSHKLIRLLGSGVEANGMIHAIVLGKWQLLVATINAGAGSIDQVLNTIVPATFQNVHEPRDIGLNVGVRILKRVANTCLRSQVHNALGPLLSKNLLYGAYVCDIRFKETEAPSSLKAIQARLFERDIVIIIEIVDAQNFVPAINKPMRDMRADEASGPCDKNFHLFIQEMNFLYL